MQDRGGQFPYTQEEFLGSARLIANCQFPSVDLKIELIRQLAIDNRK
jgi:hypothetical protein